MAKPKFLEAVPVSRIFLDLENPRHEPYRSEAQAIEYLCEHENVHALARDIVKNGLNPLERWALIPARKGKGSEATTTYTVAEGNRRLCAVKLLIDPDLAPAALRKSFERLAEGWAQIKTVAAAVFSDRESVRLWLYRVHNGAQGGAGRRDWNSDQKQRFSGGTKNKAALLLLDYAETEKFITAAERKGKLTTAQRFLGNEILREVLGLDASNPDELLRTRPKADFDVLAKRFIRDLVEGKKVNSRMNRKEIVDYARPLTALAGVTTARVESETLGAACSTARGKKRPIKPVKPGRAKHVAYDDEIAVALKALGNDKLNSLYHSIVTVELEDHTPIVSVGVWSFFETLTALAGRKSDTTSMEAWLSKAKLIAYGEATDTVSLRAAMTRIKEYGNTSKHHPVAATFNGDQLNNDVQALRNVVLKAIEEAASKGP